MADLAVADSTIWDKHTRVYISTSRSNLYLYLYLSFYLDLYKCCHVCMHMKICIRLPGALRRARPTIYIDIDI